MCDACDAPQLEFSSTTCAYTQPLQHLARHPVADDWTEDPCAHVHHRSGNGNLPDSLTWPKSRFSCSEICAHVRNSVRTRSRCFRAKTLSILRGIHLLHGLISVLVDHGLGLLPGERDLAGKAARRVTEISERGGRLVEPVEHHDQQWESTTRNRLKPEVHCSPILLFPQFMKCSRGFGLMTMCFSA
jgi:hypothetical protein